ncbi:MAG: glycosyltransferase family 4 protein [Nitrospira sp.]|nr:glycosyltransferase family 4 protein [Nitrospira sp.]
MKILIVVPWDHEYGGVASVVGNLAICLKDRGHKVLFFHPNGKAIIQKKRTTKWGFPGFQLRVGLPFGVHPFLSTLAFFALFPFTLLQLIRLIKKHDIEIVNIHYPADSFFYFGLCRRICHFSLVTSIHGADVFPRGKPKREYTLPFRFLLDSSDVLVAPSRGFQSEFLQIFPELRSKGKVIYNGINIGELAAESNHGGRILEDPYILCIAMHNEKKGLDVLLRAFKQVRNSFPTFKLVLVGDGPLRNSLEELADSLGLQEQVVFCGKQGRPEVTNILIGCEVFVLPSRSEPFGIVILEAMACKKPVIATKVAGPMEIIEDGITGILVEADNPDMLAKAMINILNRRDLQLFLGENGHLMVQEKFLSTHLGLAYEELFRKLLTQV